MDKILSIAIMTASLIAGSYCWEVSGKSDCTDVMPNSSGYGSYVGSGQQLLYIGKGRRARWAYCDMTTNGGGWTIFQRRTSAAQSFYQNWVSYEYGFGDVNGDYWLGNSYIHSMTYGKKYRLRVEFTDWAGIKHYAEYDDFRIGGAGCNYTLESLGKFCGDCGDSLTGHLNYEFSTYDRDQDTAPGVSCSVTYKGAWWYSACHSSNLNGEYKAGGVHTTYADGINWKTCGGYYYSYKSTVMMIRPVDF